MKLLFFIVIVLGEFSNNLASGKTFLFAFFVCFAKKKKRLNGAKKLSVIGKMLDIPANLAKGEKQGESTALCFDRSHRIE